MCEDDRDRLVAAREACLRLMEQSSEDSDEYSALAYTHDTLGWVLGGLR